MGINVYKNFIQKMLELPFWVKEVIYFQLRNNMQKILATEEVNINEEDLYQHYKPSITYAGKKELETIKMDTQNPVTKFLNDVVAEKSIIEITLDNVWSLEETSKIFQECINKEFVTSPQNPIAKAKVSYFAGKIRIGEYVKHIGLIDIDQLETAMRFQRESELSGKTKGFATILADSGFLSKHLIDNVLLIKEESKKRFLLSFNNSGISTSIINDNAQNQEQLVKILTHENKLLKAKLKEATEGGAKQ